MTKSAGGQRNSHQPEATRGWWLSALARYSDPQRTRPSPAMRQRDDVLRFRKYLAQVRAELVAARRHAARKAVHQVDDCDHDPILTRVVLPKPTQPDWHPTQNSPARLLSPAEHRDPATGLA